MLITIKKLIGIFTRRELLQICGLLAAIIVMALAQSVGVALVMPFLGVVMEPDLILENKRLLWVYNTLGFSSIKDFIILTGVAMFVAIFISNAVQAFVSWYKIRFLWMKNHRLSCRLLAKYLAMPYVFFLNRNSADLGKNVLFEVQQLTGSYITPLLNIITRLLMSSFILIVLFWMNTAVSIIALLIIGGSYLYIYRRVHKQLKERGAKRFQANHMRFKAVNEAFGGIKETKVLNREDFFLEGYTKASLEHGRYLAWNSVLEQIPRFALEAMAFGAIIVFVIISLISLGDTRQVIPLAGLFAFAGFRIMPALQEIFSSFTKMKFNQAVVDRLYQDITTGENQRIAPEEMLEALPKPIPFAKEITLQNISYRYPNSIRPVITGISLTIRRNTSIAFVGPTGAGKTTLADILLGLLQPGEGSLLVDGTPVDESNVKGWQRNIGYVPQFIFLSDDTISRNIAFGISDENIDVNALKHAAKIANIHDFIENELPDSYNTLVGERGIRLSGGQRQRIGIARALYHDPNILVFDEATSSLDGITEKAVLDAMENASKLKTLIIIAHRLTTVKSCDVIYMIEKGRITGTGTYEELFAGNDRFRSMARSSKWKHHLAKQN